MPLASLWKGTFAWIALAAIVAVVLATFVPRPSPRETTPPASRADAAAPQMPDSTADYLEFADRLERAAPGDRSAVVEGLRQLAGLLGSRGNPELATDLRVAAEHVVLNPDARATTELIRERFLAVAAALGTVSGPGRELQEAAEALDPARPLAAQHEQVVLFFRRVADAVRPTVARR